MVIGSGESPVLLIFVLSHVLTAVLTLGLMVYVVRSFWDKPIGRVFAGLVGAITVWIVGALARTFTTSLDTFIAVTGFKYVGIAATPIFFVLFGLLYDGKNQWVTWRAVASLLILPALSVPIAATTHIHGLFYSSYSTSMVDGMSIITITAVGPWYWIFLGYSWLLVAIGSVTLVYAGIKRSRFYRVQLFLLVPAILISWAANIAYAIFSWPHPAFDPTPIGFGMASFLLAIGVFSTKLIDITPAARSLVLDTIDDAVIVVGPNNRVVDVNEAARPLLESSATIGEPVSEILPEEITESTTASSATVELTIDTRRRYYRHRRLPIGPDDTQGSVIVFTDITAEKESQQRIKQARERLRQIIDLIPDPIFVKNRDDEILLTNESNAELVGSTPEEIEGKPEPEIFPETDHYETLRQRDEEVIESGEPTAFEEELTSSDGENHIFHTTRIPFKTANTAEDAVLDYARDVTVRKEYEQELEATKERLERTNEELETLNRILRHDIRNDAVVIGRLGRKLEGHVYEDGQEHLDNLLDRGEHIAEMTTNLRDLMQTMLDEQGELEPVRLDTILEAEIESVSATYENVSVTVASDIPRVNVQADWMLSSVFQNLLRNAIQHNDKAVPEVTVAAHDREEAVVVEVADNGPGIPDDSKDDIFGKGERGLQSKGTGVGLYLVTKLLDRYGGTVHVRDRAPRNSTGNRTMDDGGGLRLAAGQSATEQAASDGSVFVVELPRSE